MIIAVFFVALMCSLIANLFLYAALADRGDDIKALNTKTGYVHEGTLEEAIKKIVLSDEELNAWAKRYLNDTCLRESKNEAVPRR